MGAVELRPLRAARPKPARVVHHAPAGGGGRTGADLGVFVLEPAGSGGHRHGRQCSATGAVRDGIDAFLKAWLAFAACSTIWGSTFLAISIGNDALAPVWGATLRLALASLL